MQIINGVAHMTTNEVAARLGVRPATVRSWRTDADERKPQGVRVGNTVLYPASAVDEFATTYHTRG